MDSYKFGGSKLKRFNASILMRTSTFLCGIKKMYIWLARKINKVSICIKKLSIRLSKESDPMTVHITRIIPLDRWYIRIEFTVNRSEKKCLHIYSDSGEYSDVFLEYKRGGNIEPTEAYYFMISGLIKNWKKI